MLPVLFFIAIAFNAACVLAFVYGWLKLRPPLVGQRREVRLTVVVPFRNEEAALPGLIQKLQVQLKDVTGCEVLLIDDHSTDRSAGLAATMARGHAHFRLLQLTSAHGKKAAIELAVDQAQGDYVLVLDSDVQLPGRFIPTLISYLSERPCDLAILPVAMQEDKSWWPQWQALEFMSLAASTAASASLGEPLMCNGAAMVFRREVFLQLGGYEGNRHIAGGDDMFLLGKFKRDRSLRITYLHHRDLLVRTTAAPTWRDFTAQRLRWTYKVRHLHDVAVWLVASAIWLANLSVLCTCVLLCLGECPWWLTAVAATKWVLDFAFLFIASEFYGQRELLRHYVPVSILYPLYVVAVPLWSLWSKPQWKLRPLHRVVSNSLTRSYH